MARTKQQQRTQFGPDGAARCLQYSQPTQDTLSQPPMFQKVVRDPGQPGLAQPITGRFTTHGPAPAPYKTAPNLHMVKKESRVNKPQAATEAGKPAHRRKAGIIALREIKKYQKSTDLLIPLAPFARVVREITHEVDKADNITCWTKEAMLALQEAVEMHLVELCEDANIAAIHAGRVTLMAKDISLAKRLRHDAVNMP